MKAVDRAVAVLERAKEKVEEKLAGLTELQAEREAIESALGELRKVSNGTPAKRRGGGQVKLCDAA